MASLTSVPLALVYMFWPDFGTPVNEDLFSSTEGGADRWYPNTGTWVPFPLPLPVRFGGRGRAVRGRVQCSVGLVRFNPSPYWQRRGLTSWEFNIVGTGHVEGKWRTFANAEGGEVVLRVAESSQE